MGEVDTKSNFGYRGNFLGSCVDNNVCLNLGCGEKVIPGWVNIDLYVRHDKVVRMNICHLDYKNNSVDKIFSSMVIEHQPWTETDNVLKEWCRVLKGGGKIFLGTANLDALCRDWLLKDTDYQTNIRGIYGKQNREGEFHQAGFDFQLLKEKMEKAGFKNIIEILTDHSHHLWVEATK